MFDKDVAALAVAAQPRQLDVESVSDILALAAYDEETRVLPST